MLLAAVDGYPTVWTLKVYTGRGRALLGRLASLEIHRILGGSGRLMVRMRTVCMLSHKRCSLANLRYRRVRKRVEEGVLSQDHGSLDTLWINVLEWLKWLLEAAVGRSREASPGRCQLRLRWTFGGMISLRGDILGERAERLRGAKGSTRALDSGQAPRAGVRGSHPDQLASGHGGVTAAAQHLGR